MADWTQDKTESAPTRITIEYSPRSAPKTTRKQPLISTQRTTTTTAYRTFEYKDAEGQPQQEDVATRQEAITRNTVAAVCQAYVAARLSEAMGLPVGDANKRETTTYRYTVTTEGVRLLKERSEIWISQYELVGGLNVPFDTIISTPGSLPWVPTGRQLLSAITETVYEEAVIPGPFPGAPGKPYTRTKVSRWACRGQTQEGKEAFNASMKTIDSTNAAARLPGLVADMEQVVFDGTEIRTSIGRTPVLSRPTGQEQDYADIEERKDDQTADSTFYDDKSWPAVDLDYGGPDLPDWTDWDKTNPDTNEPDWKDLVPKWQDYDTKDPIPDDDELTDTDPPPDPDNPDQPNPDPNDPNQPNPDPNNPGPTTTTDEPDWAPLVPTWDAYDGVDSNNDGTPDWADFVPSDKDWRDLQADSNGDGIPDWADYVPDWTAYDGVDSDGDGVPDWAAFVPGWETYQGDSNGDGVPDWAEFVPDGSTRSRTYITATYEMPFASDDFWLYNTAAGQTLVRSGASEAARKFGEIENSLRTGHALGINITSEAKALPTAPLAPIYVRAEGLVAGFLMNGVSWAFDGNGLVVSADLLLMGVAGLDPSVEEAQAWVRLPAGTGGLQTLDLDPDIGSLTPANTIDIPEDLPAADRYRVFRWLPRDGADVLGPYLDPDRSLVAPFLPRSRMIGRSRHRAQMEEYAFRLSTTEELVGVVRTLVGEPVSLPPLLGAGPATNTDGWDEVTVDPGGYFFEELSGWSHPITLGEHQFYGGWIRSDYLWIEFPPGPGDDWSTTWAMRFGLNAGYASIQRILQQITEAGTRIRIEANTVESGPWLAGSNRILEITFAGVVNGSQVIEVRSGLYEASAETLGELWLGNDDTPDLVSAEMRENGNWLLLGSLDGTSWSAIPGGNLGA